MTPVIWQAIGVFSTILAALLLILLLWRRRELRRMRAMEVSGELAKWDLTMLTRLMNAYAVGNYIGKDSVTRVLHQIIDEIQEGGLPLMLKKVTWKVIKNVILVDPDERKELIKLIEATQPKPPAESTADPIATSPASNITT